MSKESYFLLMIIVAGFVTIGLRAFPFLVFGKGKTPPPIIGYIGDVLSSGAIAMLVVYCLCAVYSGKSFATGGWGLPELLASAVVVGLQIWKKNPLLSICSGTALYMFSVQYLLKFI